MTKTTIYLPDSMKEQLTREAAGRGVSEATVIREAIAMLLSSVERPRPVPGVFADGGMDLTRLDDYLGGFGQ
jgi:hypothetical protein